MSIKRHGVGPRLSQAVVHGNTVYLAGIVAGDPSADAKGQTEQILKKIDDHLAATGSHKSKLLSATIYVASMAPLQRHERGVGRLGGSGQHAGARHRGSATGLAEVRGRDHGRGGDLRNRGARDPLRAARFKDKVVLITGAAGGIGRAAAVRFAAEGARVGLVDVSRDGLDRVARRGREGGRRRRSPSRPT